jgi:hypothetical protein
MTRSLAEVGVGRRCVGADWIMRRIPRTVIVSTLFLVSGAAVLSGCGPQGGDLATARSAERGEAASADVPSGSDAELCEAILGLSEQQDVSLDDGPEAAREAAEQVRELAAAAPAEVGDALEVFADLFEQMASLEDEGDGGLDAFGEILGQMMDPEVIAASETLTDYMVQECGADPLDDGQGFGLDPFAEGEGSSDGFDDSGADPEQGDPSDISLDDLDAIKEAHDGASWVDKLFSTSIGNNRSVQLGAPDDDDDFGAESLSTTEAVEACEAVRIALEDRQPDLTVEVTNGETTVASGAAGVPCTAT